MATLTSDPTTATQERADVSVETQTDEPLSVVAEALTSALSTHPPLEKVKRDMEDTFNFQIKSLLQVRGTCESVPQLVDMLGRARKKVRGLLPSQPSNCVPTQSETSRSTARTHTSSSGPPATFYNAPQTEVEPSRPCKENTAPSTSSHHVPENEDIVSIVSSGSPVG